MNKKRKPFHIPFKKTKISPPVEIEKKELKPNFGLGRGILGKTIIKILELTIRLKLKYVIQMIITSKKKLHDLKSKFLDFCLLRVRMQIQGSLNKELLTKPVKI